MEAISGLSLKDLIDAGLHFGHQTKRWNPKMKRYIFDKRNGIHIIDLTQTLPMLEEACAFLRDTVLNGKQVLFVATKKQAQDIVKEAAVASGQFHMVERWLGGALTNYDTIKKSIKRMRQLQSMARNNNGVLSVHKKEASSLRRELDKLEINLGGIADMDRLPGAMFVVDICRESNAVKEAKCLGIPVVAIVDTNADPDPIDYIIPGNDDAVRGVKLIVDAVAKLLKEASESYSKAAVERQRQLDAERAAAGEAAPPSADGDRPRRPRRDDRDRPRRDDRGGDRRDRGERGERRDDRGGDRGGDRPDRGERRERGPRDHAPTDEAQQALAKTRRSAAAAAAESLAAQAAAVEPAPAQ